MITKDSFAKWRNALIKILLLLVLILSLLEFLIYFILDPSMLLAKNYREYITTYALKPTVLNLGTWLIGALFVRYLNVKNRVRNMIPLISLLFICFWTAYFHKYFATSLCTFGLVVILSSMFGDLMVSRGLAVTSVLMILLVYILPPVDSVADARLEFADVLVSIFFIGITYVFTRLIILYNLERERILRKNYSRMDDLEKKLLTDRLTGLYNHTGFYHILENQIIECREARKPLSLVVIDIDDFKKVNDTYGHENGNKVLVALATLFEEVCGTKAYACRYGGEEFSLIFPGFTVYQTREIMEQVRREFAESSYPFLPEGGITFSCGIKGYAKGMDSPQVLFEYADKAMYCAKKKGKNQVYAIADGPLMRVSGGQTSR